MPTACLIGAEHTQIGEIAAIAEGSAAIAISRGGAKKTYSYKDPNEDVTAFATTDWGLLAVVADGHSGHRGAEVAVNRILERHVPRWLGPSAVALESRFSEEGAEVLADVNAAMVSAADPLDSEPSRTTLSIGLVRPREGYLATLSVGDSHVFRIGAAGAQEWLPNVGPRALYLGMASHDRERLGKAVRAEVCELGTTTGLVLATDGLSEPGIGVKDPARAVSEAIEEALEGDPERFFIDGARGVVERALAAQRTNKAGDNAASAVLWWAPKDG